MLVLVLLLLAMMALFWQSVMTEAKLSYGILLPINCFRLYLNKTGLKTMHSPQLYQNMNITRIEGLTEAQKMTLKALGAVEKD